MSKSTKKSGKQIKPPKTPKPKAEKKPADAKPKRLSALDAAAQVLQKSGQAMRSTEMIAAMAEQELWASPKGKTPHATLYAAILREIGTKAQGRPVPQGRTREVPVQRVATRLANSLPHSVGGAGAVSR